AIPYVISDTNQLSLSHKIKIMLNDVTIYVLIYEEDRLLHPFCAALNKLQRDKARLDHHNKVLSMGQLRNDMNYRRKKTEIDESQKKFHSENYVAPVEESEIQESEISNESFIGDIENEVQLGPIGSIERIKRTRHPAINRQKGKWEIEEIFEYNLDDPSFYQEL
ncbi:14680_t:CDS:2, partial [Entrophospora sp. SA101]